ncbi:ParB N-terminal domain-containing protein [Patescibacteria group bacterium]|nr:ParB N-terminal domain-containing protein [Patescibacteria group bacterium]MCL5798397.1 ParB N-terminal domain-containing protein [Patescibacteria group bacterium]
MKTDIFHIQIVPLEDIMPHEEFDESRAWPLVRRLKEEKFLANPIIVASLSGEKYLQLDGMNRYSAFKLLKLPSIACQIIDYNDQESVELSSWVHLFRGQKDDFLKYIDNDKDFSVRQGKAENVGHRYIKEEGIGRLCTLCTRDGEVYLISTNGKLWEKVEKLNRLVDYYKNKITRDVLPVNTNWADIKLLFAEHPEADLMMVFPTFTRHQIVDVVNRKQLFPTGVSRHIIKRRCLNVKVPLSIFEKNSSIEKQNEELEKLFSKRPFRLYEEPTIYFE